MTKAINLAALGSVVTVPTGDAPSFQCRAWVNFNGTGTVAIRGSGNVSSITDNGTGDYTANFTTSMPDANYSLVGATGNNSNGSALGAMAVQLEMNTTATQTTTSVRFCAMRQFNPYTNFDPAQINVAIFR